jgi:hypothetical protein
MLSDRIKEKEDIIIELILDKNLYVTEVIDILMDHISSDKLDEIIAEIKKI